MVDLVVINLGSSNKTQAGNRIFFPVEVIGEEGGDAWTPPDLLEGGGGGGAPFDSREYVVRFRPIQPVKGGGGFLSAFSAHVCKLLLQGGGGGGATWGCPWDGP